MEVICLILSSCLFSKPRPSLGHLMAFAFLVVFVLKLHPGEPDNQVKLQTRECVSADADAGLSGASRGGGAAGQGKAWLWILRGLGLRQ